MSSLLSCPFCGSGNVSQKEHTQYGHGDSTCGVYVECNSCRSHGPDTGFWGTPTEAQRGGAISGWNNRTPAPAQP